MSYVRPIDHYIIIDAVGRVMVDRQLRLNTADVKQRYDLTRLRGVISRLDAMTNLEIEDLEILDYMRQDRYMSDKEFNKIFSQTNLIST